VDRRTKGGSYVLREMDGTILRQGVAAFRLYPYISRDSPLLNSISDNELSDDSDSESGFSVDDD
jgi:hypothetical protein